MVFNTILAASHDFQASPTENPAEGKCQPLRYDCAAVYPGVSPCSDVRVTRYCRPLPVRSTWSDNTRFRTEDGLSMEYMLLRNRGYRDR
jgi:hypothetical protein